MGRLRVSVAQRGAVVHAPLVVTYLSRMSLPRATLWCYLIWWLGVSIPYFDPSPVLWLNSLGIAVIIGTGLYLSTAYAGQAKVTLPRLAVARLYMMPFFVSSFAALIKGRGFWLVFHPNLADNLKPFAFCALFIALTWAAKRVRGVAASPVAT
jgi:hypothetical protein